MTDLPQFLLTGDRLALTQPTRGHLETYHRWENDPGTIHAYGNHFPQAWEVRVAGWDRQRANERYRQFEVALADTGAPVGMTTLAVNPYVNTAEYTLLIGPEHRRQGYAAEATRLTLEWAFARAALRAVWLKVLTPNTSAIRAYTEAGFQEAGRLRAAGYWNGQPVDELLMDALADDHRGNGALSDRT